MSKVLFTCALVVNLLMVTCDAATTKPTKIPKLIGKLVDIVPLVDIIFGRVGDLFSDSRSPNAAFPNDNDDGDERTVTESLQELLANANKLETFPLGRRQKESRGQTISVPEDLDDTIMERRQKYTTTRD